MINTETKGKNFRGLRDAREPNSYLPTQHTKGLAAGVEMYVRRGLPK